MSLNAKPEDAPALITFRRGLKKIHKRVDRDIQEFQTTNLASGSLLRVRTTLDAFTEEVHTLWIPVQQNLFSDPNSLAEAAISKRDTLDYISKAGSNRVNDLRVTFLDTSLNAAKFAVSVRVEVFAAHAAFCPRSTAYDSCATDQRVKAGSAAAAARHFAEHKCLEAEGKTLLSEVEIYSSSVRAAHTQLNANAYFGISRADCDQIQILVLEVDGMGAEVMVLVKTLNSHWSLLSSLYDEFTCTAAQVQRYAADLAKRRDEGGQLHCLYVGAIHSVLNDAQMVAQREIPSLSLSMEDYGLSKATQNALLEGEWHVQQAQIRVKNWRNDLACLLVADGNLSAFRPAI